MPTTKARSARGEIVDFDLLRIREKLASAPRPVEVKERENYVESKSRRRRKKKLDEKVEETVSEEETQEETESEDKTEE